MESSIKKDLLSTVEKQKDQITRYETRLRDLVVAYKGLLKEKEALEASLKAISESKSGLAKPSNVNTPDVVDSTLDCDGALHSNDGETHTPPNDKGGGEIKETPEQLRVQLQTLMNSLATLSAEKSRMEASFQADKKHLRTDREEKEKVVKELQEKLQQSTKQHQLDVENMKSKLIIERHERDKERSDHAVMIRELQKVVAEERRLKEQHENLVEELLGKLTGMDAQLGQKETLEKKVRDLQNELESARRKLKRAEAKAKETPPLLLELQEEMAAMKLQHQAAIFKEQKRASDAEERAQKSAASHEERVANLEARLAELSDIVGTYDRVRQQDQLAIQTLKERIAQFDFDTGGAPAKVAEEESKAESELVGTSDEVQAIVDKILYYRGLLEKANKNSEKTEDVLALWSIGGKSSSPGGSEEHHSCKQRYQQLKQEFDLYRQQTAKQSLSNLRVEDGGSEIQSLQNQVKNLRERVRVLTVQQDDLESEHKQELELHEEKLKAERAKMKVELKSCENDFRARQLLLEQQLQKQRERTLALLEEKDQEIQTLKASFQMFLPGRGIESSSDPSDLKGPADDVLGSLSQFGSGASGSNSPHMLHYAHELARRDVEITSLRRTRHQLEAALREQRRLTTTADERHASEKLNMQEEIDRLVRCQSREGANLEYLKNVVLSYLLTTDVASKGHMLNAIAAVLKFSDKELDKVFQASTVVKS